MKQIRRYKVNTEYLQVNRQVNKLQSCTAKVNTQKCTQIQQQNSGAEFFNSLTSEPDNWMKGRQPIASKHRYYFK